MMDDEIVKVSFVLYRVNYGTGSVLPDNGIVIIRAPFDSEGWSHGMTWVPVSDHVGGSQQWLGALPGGDDHDIGGSVRQPPPTSP